MRIISKHHDFYDTAISFGVDRSLVYKRHEETIRGVSDEIGLDLNDLPLTSHLGNAKTGRWEDCPTFTLHMLLFCGELIPFVVERHRQEWLGPLRTATHWTLDSVETAIAAHPLTRAAYEERRIESKLFVRKTVRDVFGHRIGSDRLAAIHEAHRSPVVLYRNLEMRCNQFRPIGVETVRNPILRDIGFQSHRDPYATYQAIAMYLGGVMRQAEQDTVTLTDEERRDKHGMDKWSFRKRSDVKL